MTIPLSCNYITDPTLLRYRRYTTDAMLPTLWKFIPIAIPNCILSDSSLYRDTDLFVSRFDSVIGGTEDLDEYSARVIEPHPLFGNNFDLINLPKHGLVYQSVEKAKLRGDQGTFDVLFYLAAKLFKVSNFYLHLLHGTGILFKKSFDHLVGYGIGSKLKAVLCCNRIAYLINLLSTSLFDSKNDPSSTNEDTLRQRLRKDQALENFQAYLRARSAPKVGGGN